MEHVLGKYMISDKHRRGVGSRVRHGDRREMVMSPLIAQSVGRILVTGEMPFDVPRTGVDEKP